MKKQDDVPHGMRSPSPAFDSEGRPICWICGDLLKTGTRTGGNWALANKKKGTHLCTKHPAAALYRSKTTERERAKRQKTIEEPRKEWLPLLEFHKMIMARRAQKQARREATSNTGLPLVDHG